MNDVLWMKRIMGIILAMPIGAEQNLLLKKFERLVSDVAEVPTRVIMMLDAGTFADAADIASTYTQELTRALDRWEHDL